MKKKIRTSKPCEECGENKWKTFHKRNGERKIVECRNCGNQRILTQ